MAADVPIIFSANRLKLLWRQKKEAKHFNFLPTSKPKAARKLRPLIDACPNLRDACAQVVTYCAMHGAPLAIVCNGPQLVMFHSYIAGQSPMDGECFVFDGFSTYLENFPDLWRLLSPEGVFENKAYRSIAMLRNPRIPTKASTAIVEPNQYRYRTDFQENLRTLATLLLENVEDNPDVKSDFYRECYVDLDANNRHLLLSKNIIASRYRRAGDGGLVPARIAASVSKGRIAVNDDIVAASVGTSRPIVVIGDVGVGKTSFFENLFQQIQDDATSDACYIHLNLGEHAALSRDVKTYVIGEIPKILKRNYDIDIFSADLVESIYKSDLADFESRPEAAIRSVDERQYFIERLKFISSKTGQADTHIVEALKYAATILHRQIIIVIDNADQRTFETQQEAFIVAQELAATRAPLVFVALRPSTFYQSKLSGALSGYQNQVLTISPPPADEVVRKRIAFALKVAEGRIAPAALENVRFNLTNIVLFLTATLRSIRANAAIRTFLSNVTGGNTRAVIELITTFCGSPNVESERIVRIESETGEYQVPLHEFTKHALLGDFAYYSPTSSLVACNVFDISSADAREHFLSALIPAYLTSPLGIRDNDGFVPATAVLGEMLRIGFHEDQVRASLRRLAKLKLIETPFGHYRELAVEDEVHPDTFHFRATSVGVYHIRYWIGSFSFLDAVSIDTPIFKEEVRELVFHRANATDIGSRYEKATAFRGYLEGVWHEANYDMNYYDFVSILRDQRDSFLSVERFLASPPRRRS